MKSEYSLSISEAAELDIRDAFLWYEDQKDNLDLPLKKTSLKPFKTFKRIL